MTPSERTAPVQVNVWRNRPAPSVPWAVHVRAWQAYAALGHGGQSAERIAERGGFGWSEMVLMLAEWNPWGDRPMTEEQRERFARYRAAGRGIVTPSERQRRIEAAARAWCEVVDGPGCEPDMQDRNAAMVSLDAADREVPVVSEAEYNALAHEVLEAVCVASTLQSARKALPGLGVRMARAEERAEQAEAAARDFADLLGKIAEAVYRSNVSIRSGDLSTHVRFKLGDWSTVQAARDVLQAHPSFSGEEGIDG